MFQISYSFTFGTNANLQRLLTIVIFIYMLYLVKSKAVLKEDILLCVTGYSCILFSNICSNSVEVKKLQLFTL